MGEAPPRRLVRKLLPLLSLAPRKLDRVALVAHFGFGAAIGSIFALLPAERRATLGGVAAEYRWRRGLTELPLRGKVALVRGGSRGLGRASARELLKRGASVARAGGGVPAAATKSALAAAEGVRSRGSRGYELI